MIFRFLKSYSKELYFVGLALLAIGLPFSRFMMSFGLFWLAGTWIIELEYLRKIRAFWSNKPAVLLSSVLLLHVVGLLYTSDFNYALNDIRIKLPLFLIPFLLSGMPALTKKELKFFLYLFLLAVLSTSVFNALIYFDVILPNWAVHDTRKISYFISHIRLGLMLSLSIMILIYLLFRDNKKLRPIYALLIIWFVAFLYILESFTGFTTLVIGTIVLLVVYTFRLRNKTFRLISLVTALTVFLVTFFYVKGFYDSYYTLKEDFTNLPVETPYGEEYFHAKENNQIESGHYIYNNIAIGELKSTWSEVSEYPYDGYDDRGQPILGTLIRYLTSKGLQKDKNGVNSLTESDIKNIESGVANVNYVDGGIRKRIFQTFYEIDAYNRHSNPTGNSFTQRLEYWKNGWSIVKNHPLIGVGTGDVQAAFNEAYKRNQTKLKQEHWNRAHNQFLTFLITFGFIGFAWIMFVFSYPLIMGKRRITFYYLSFFVIAMLSFLWEDTLETQTGVTFFAFFYGLFLVLDVSENKSVKIAQGKTGNS